MNDTNDISAQLRALVERAEFIRKDQQVGTVIEQHNDLFERHQLRLRPSVGSFSLVSCSPLSPQLGKPGLQNANQLARKLEGLQSGSWTLKEPIKKTPEKALQSWLISTARADGEVSSISAAAQNGTRYWLVTDEIALEGPENKFVADMLLVKEFADGLAELVNAELKYERSTKTFKQVEAFRTVLERDDLTILWRKFAETMTGKRFKWDEDLRSTGLVIWPGLAEGKVAPKSTVERLRAEKQNRIDTLGYYGPPFSLALEEAGSANETTT